MHSTNAAFERYFQMGEKSLREIYATSQTGKQMVNENGGLATPKLLTFKAKIGGADGT
jgi:hypothetical protein